jgi:ABC-type phosphate/phosphonate transport system permease subunit
MSNSTEERVITVAIAGTLLAIFVAAPLAATYLDLIAG